MTDPRMLMGLGAATMALACSDLATPAELARPQIIAVRATPAAIPDGASATLEVVLAGPDGLVTPAQVDWDCQTPGLAAVRGAGQGTELVATSPDAAVATLLVEVTLEDGQVLTARKSVEVGVPARDNPTFAIHANGRPLPEAEILDATSGQLVDLALVPDGALAEPVVSWYATIGEIDEYRAPQSAWQAPGEAADGALFAVLRDGRGGVSWQRLPLRVRP